MGEITRAMAKRTKSAKVAEARAARMKQVVKRQGDLCWFCNEKMGYDCTREHLLARARGGTDEAANIRAAHGDCNAAAGHLSVKKKYELRRIGHAAGRLAVLEAAHRMRRHQSYTAYLGARPKAHKTLTAVTAEGSTVAVFKKLSATEKGRRRLENQQREEAARVKKEARAEYWAKLGLLEKPSWWDG